MFSFQHSYSEQQFLGINYDIVEKKMVLKLLQMKIESAILKLIFYIATVGPNRQT